MSKTFTPLEHIRDSSDGLLWLGLVIQRSIKSSSVTVATTATKIPTSPLSKRKTVIIMNISTNIIYIGASDVTISTGFPIYPRGVMQIAIEESIDIYGIASGSSAIRILEGA